MRRRWPLEEKQKKTEHTPKKKANKLPADVVRTARRQESEEAPGEGPGKAEAVEEEDEVY